MNQPDRHQCGQPVRSDLNSVEDQITVLQGVGTRGEQTDDNDCYFIVPRRISQNQCNQYERATDDPGVERQMPPGDVDLLAATQIHVLEPFSFRRKVEDASRVMTDPTVQILLAKRRTRSTEKHFAKPRPGLYAKVFGSSD